MFIHTKAKIAVLTILISSIPLPALARVKLYTSCRMGSCTDSYFISKTPIQTVGKDTLYLVEEEFFYSSQEGAPYRPSSKQISTKHILCSKQSAAIISKRNPQYNYANDPPYSVRFLNPGGIVGSPNAPDHVIYWATCHNFIDTFFKELPEQALQLGYPLNLQTRQADLYHPTDIFLIR